MDPLTILSLASSGVQAASGIGRSLMGGIQLLGNKRPADYTYNIPPEVQEAVRLAKTRLANPLPGADLQRNRIDQTTAGQIAQVAKMGGASGTSVGAASSMLGSQLESLNALAIKEGEAKLNAEQVLSGALGMSAQYKDRKFDLNVRRPYEQALAEFFQRKNEGAANLFGGLNDAGYAGQSFYQNKLLMDELGGDGTREEDTREEDTGSSYDISQINWSNPTFPGSGVLKYPTPPGSGVLKY